MGDSYRPGESRRPPFRESDTYRPRQYDPPSPPRPHSNYSNNDMYHFRGSRIREPPRPFTHRPRPGYQNTRPPTGSRQDQRRRPPPPTIKTAANRPLFRFKHGDATVSSGTGPGSEAKYRNLDELTDSDEEEMAQSEDEGHRHVNKRIRLDRAHSGVAPASKWSNPDPYTSLPPMGDVTAKRTDVVKLIRKARIDTDRSNSRAKNPDEFISFDADEHSSSDHSRLSPHPPPPPPPPPALAPVPPPSPPALASVPRAIPTSTVTGKRKRGPEVGDEGRRPRLDNRVYADHHIEDQWLATPGVDWTPWVQSHPPTDSAGVALHKEILDFYGWVKPKPHEEEVRGAVFQRLDKYLRNFMPGELKAFGSYAAGLYLPTADMDLVYLTRSYKPGRPSKALAGKLVTAVAASLKRSGIAQGTVVPIAHARVPIIKFVDRISGLKIDLSFDNDSGLVAIDTFRKWIKDQPIMPIIVSVVKQYLMIRGLNDVSTGGLGGFSAICLVTSFLQHLPITQRPVNLGDVLLEFFNFYGNVFDQKATILRLDPPAYLDKATHPHRFTDKDNARLTIIDPHKFDNNISGGTKRIDVILDCFSKAQSALATRLAAHEKRPTGGQSSSFLGCLIGGNFTPYADQREVLQNLSVNSHARLAGGDEGRRIKGSARSIEVDHRGKRNDRSRVADSASDAKEPTGNRNKAGKGVRRAQRLKGARPELAASIRSSISVVDALKLGGYKTPDDMYHDLTVRDGAAAKLAAKQAKQ